MMKLRKYWYIPFALLTLVALVAASPTPRKLLSETFTNWIMIEGLSPMIYHDTTSTSGGSLGMTYYRDNDDNVDFSAGVQYSDGDVTYYSLRAGEYNGTLGVYVDTDGDVGIGGVPDAGMELDVDGDIYASGNIYSSGDIEGGSLSLGQNLTAAGQVQAEHLKSTDDAEVAYDLTVGDDITAYKITATHNLYADDDAYIDGTVYANHFYPQGYGNDDIDFSPVANITQDNGDFVSSGDAQGQRIVVRKAVTFSDASWHALAVNGDAIYPYLADADPGVLWAFDCLVVVTTENAGESAGYKIEGLIDLAGGDSVLYSNVTTMYEDDASWDAQVTLTGAGGVKIEVRDADGNGDIVKAVALINAVQVVFE